MGQRHDEGVAGSSLWRGARSLLVTYAIVGLPVLHLWAPMYFKGQNIWFYQAAFVTTFCVLSLVLPPMRDSHSSLRRLVVWGAGAGFAAGVVANALADYMIMEVGTSIGAWLAGRVSFASLVLLSIALLSWVFGAAFGLVTWLIDRRRGNDLAPT